VQTSNNGEDSIQQDLPKRRAERLVLPYLNNASHNGRRAEGQEESGVISIQALMTRE
jgi:hypothetical protein